MKRDISNMSMYTGCDPIYISPVVDPDYVPVDDDMQRILREIYSVDEFTGVPKGDLAYYLSPDGNPQIKDWLVSNLLQPRVAQSGTSLEDVTDDMLAEFARGSDESVDQYRERLSSIYQQATDDIERIKSENHGNE